VLCFWSGLTEMNAKTPRRLLLVVARQNLNSLSRDLDVALAARTGMGAFH